MEKLLTINQLSDRMQVSRQAVYLWMEKGMPVEIKSPTRFLWEDCKEWFNSRKGEKK